MIKDDGKGFDTGMVSRGNGLQNIQKRAEEMKGTLHIHSSFGNGTRKELKGPLATISD